MSNKSRQEVEKGYKPQKTSIPIKDRDGGITGGYQPTRSKGDNPGNKPPPKKP